ncbi:MAG: GNAT family N-acetyltransferase [Dehalococcoidales bacterium]|jgi:ribosomal protein S18 acetylase RimI-like enzyme
MEIVIKELTVELLPDINKANDEFVIDSKIVPHYDNNRLSYTVVPVPAYHKKYQPETPDFYASHVGSPDKVGFIAYSDGRVAGQLLMHRNWNRFAWIEDIRVDVKFRRQGIGKTLISCGEQWARKNSFPGIMLETQDTNVKACRFYESNGFVLGGFDTILYHAARLYADEIALFWYLVF